MNNSTREFFLSYILENKVTDVLRVYNCRLQFLGIEFPIRVNEAGSIISINNVELNDLICRRLTYEVWSIDNLTSTLIKVEADQKENILQLRKKAIKLLIRVLSELKSRETENDVVSLIENVGKERRFLKKSLYEISTCA